MPPGDEASPTPSNIPPTVPKRPRPSAAAGPASGPSRSKRRKADENVDTEDSAVGKGKQPVNFGVGMVKGREDEWGEPADVVTKIDFNTLPDEALYKYLEYHDLLPRWTASPWSEEPCTPPNALYTLASQPALIPIVPESGSRPTETEPESEPPAPSSAPAVEAQPVEDVSMPDGAEKQPVEAGAEGDEKDATEGNDGEGDHPIGDEADEDTPAPPTTRSKTAPNRKPPTPPPTSPTPMPEVKRGVITLSDVHAARAALAEKANAHWVKGLGGGQNKEGETIVNFLYKMKAGPGRLLRVYNPFPPPTEY